MKLSVPLGKALNGDRSFIFSISELDCYQAWRASPQYAGIHITPLPLGCAQTAVRAWAYLAGDYAHWNLVVSTLNPNCEFKPLKDALLNTSVSIHHGGLTTTISCLLAGIPQLILPRYLEQQLNAFSLVGLGVAQMVISPTWENLLMAQAQTYALTEKAKQLAERFSRWNQNPIDTIVESCFQLIA